MTKENRLRAKIEHLSFNDIRIMYEVLFERFREIGEPIPPWEHVNKRNVEHLAELPAMSLFGDEIYPTLESKAAEMMYKINKGHIFPNGNKRMSVACVFLFLLLNGKILNVSPDDARDKALNLAQSDAQDFELVKKDLRQWIVDHIEDAK